MKRPQLRRNGTVIKMSNLRFPQGTDMVHLFRTSLGVMALAAAAFGPGGGALAVTASPRATSPGTISNQIRFRRDMPPLRCDQHKPHSLSASDWVRMHELYSFLASHGSPVFGSHSVVKIPLTSFAEVWKRV